MNRLTERWEREAQSLRMRRHSFVSECYLPPPCAARAARRASHASLALTGAAPGRTPACCCGGCRCCWPWCCATRCAALPGTCSGGGWAVRVCGRCCCCCCCCWSPPPGPMSCRCCCSCICCCCACACCSWRCCICICCICVVVCCIRGACCCCICCCIPIPVRAADQLLVGGGCPAAGRPGITCCCTCCCCNGARCGGGCAGRICSGC